VHSINTINPGQPPLKQWEVVRASCGPRITVFFSSNVKFSSQLHLVDLGSAKVSIPYFCAFYNVPNFISLTKKIALGKICARSFSGYKKFQSFGF
jgi:hypothetical protein